MKVWTRRSLSNPRSFHPHSCHRLSRAPIAASSPSSDPLPTFDDDIIEWAHSKFVQWATTPRATADQPLAKACLLLSIEEAAAAAAAQHPPPIQSETKPTDSTKSTWNSQRLDLLADTARSLFYQECPSPTTQLPNSLPSFQDEHLQLIQTYPMQLILSINKTLNQQGYRRMKKHGDIQSSLISNVLETGTGSPAALAVLYIEIAARLGMTLRPCLLEEGRYVLLKATGDVLLRSPLLHNQDDNGGESEDFLIDPYAGGEIYSTSECCDLFREDEIQPSSNRQLLAALLLGLQEAYWAVAVGCPPEPSFMIPISLDVALNTYDDIDISINMTGDGDNEGEGRNTASLWRPKRGFHLWRSLAACSKRCVLLPDDRDVKLERTLLLYFSRQFKEAKDELTELININDDEKTRDNMLSLLQRLNLELSLLTAAPM